MSQQAQYITNLERALEGLLECFDDFGQRNVVHPVVTVIDNDSQVEIAAKVGYDLLSAIEYANEVMYGADALMEDEI